MKISRKATSEIIFLLFLFLFFSYIFVGALHFPKDAKLMPMLLSVPCIATSLFLLARCMLQNRVVGADKNPEKTSFKKLFPFVFSILYFLAVYIVGYNIATFVVMILVPVILGYKNKKAIIISTVLVFAIVILFFNMLLSLPSYKGLLGLI